MYKQGNERYGISLGKQNGEKTGTLTSRLSQRYRHSMIEMTIVSRVKETVTKNKIKKQKRIILNTTEKLYEKYPMKNTTKKVSYTKI